MVIAKFYALHVMATEASPVRIAMAKEKFIVCIAKEVVKKSVAYVKGVGYNLMD